jgi:hypothetical protein
MTVVTRSRCLAAPRLPCPSTWLTLPSAMQDRACRRHPHRFRLMLQICEMDERFWRDNGFSHSRCTVFDTVVHVSQNKVERRPHRRWVINASPGFRKWWQRHIARGIQRQCRECGSRSAPKAEAIGTRTNTNPWMRRGRRRPKHRRCANIRKRVTTWHHTRT